MTETQTIDTMEDILKMLDARLREPEPFWDKFYENRSKPVLFFLEHSGRELSSLRRTGLDLAGRHTRSRYRTGAKCDLSRNTRFLGDWTGSFSNRVRMGNGTSTTD